MSISIQTTSIWITWTIVHFVWMGICLWFVVQLFKLCLSRNRPATDYRVSLFGLLALILCFPVAMWFALPDFPSPPVENHSDAATVIGLSTSRQEPVPWDENDRFENPSAAVSISRDKHTDIPLADSAPDETNNIDSQDRVQIAKSFWLAQTKKTITGLAPAVAGLYFGGVLFMLARLMFMFVGCKTIQRKSASIQDVAIVNRVIYLAEQIGLRAIPVVRLTTHVATPVVVGLFKPMLLIPGSILTGMTVGELDSILIHELAHLKRRDHIIVLLQRAAEAVFFFHPVVWHMSRQLSLAREICCDDLVLAQGTSPLDYARGLCNVAELSQSGKIPKIASAATGEAPSELLSRVRRVLGESPSVKIGPPRIAILAATVLIISPFLVVQGFSVFAPSVVPPTIYTSMPNQKASTTDPVSTNANSNLDTQDSAAAMDSKKTFSVEASKPYSISGIATPRTSTIAQDLPEKVTEGRLSGNSSLDSESRPRDNSGTSDPGEDEPKAYSISGKVIGMDGRPMPGAVIRSIDDNQPAKIITADGNGDFRVAFDCRYYAFLVVYSPDRTQVGLIKFMDRKQVMEAESVPVEVQLEPVHARKVLVTKNGMPVEGAIVIGRPTGFPLEMAHEKSAANGQADLLIPSNEILDQVWAWHEDLGVGNWTNSAGEDGDINIELNPTRKCTVRVLDENEQPVANIRVMPSFRPKQGQQSPGLIHDAMRLTDQDGRAEFGWLPPADQFIFWPGVYGDRYYDWDQSKTLRARDVKKPNDRVLYVARKPGRILLRGKLAGADGDLKNIRVTGHALAKPLGDIFDTYTNEEGEFEAEVRAGLMYAIGVTDVRWASDFKTIVVDSETPASQPVVIDVYEATPITITLTAGPSHSPVIEGGVEYSVRKIVNVPELGRTQLAIMQSKQFDERGQVVFGAPDGQVELRIMTDGWELTKKVRVKRGQPEEVNAHAPAIGSRTITGKIKWPTNSLSPVLERDIASLELELAAASERLGNSHPLVRALQARIDLMKDFAAELPQASEIQLFDLGENAVTARVKSQPDGSWSAKIDCQHIAVTVMSEDKGFGALVFADNVVDSVPPIQLRPTVMVSGKLVDEQGSPMPNMALVQHYDGSRSNQENRYFNYLETKSDQDGNFVFAGVVTGIPQRLCLKLSAGSLHYLGNVKTYRPGENVHGLEVVFVDYGKTKTNSTKANDQPNKANPVLFSEELERVTTMARAADMHGLFTLASENDFETVNSLIAQSSEDLGEEITILDFLPRTMLVGETTLSNESEKLLSDMNLQLPKNKQIVCFIMDGKGQKLEARTFATDSPDLKAEFRDFLRRNSPPQRDARKLFEAALQEAQAQDKKVFVKIGGPRCGPCLKMGAWMDKYKATFEKDYVLFDFHPGRYENGVELAEQLVETYGGVPWFTILDANGKELINSDGPLGNVGFPIGGAQSTDHFVKMISDTRQRISNEEIEELRKSLAEYEYP